MRCLMGLAEELACLDLETIAVETHQSSGLGNIT